VLPSIDQSVAVSGRTVSHHANRRAWMMPEGGAIVSPLRFDPESDRFVRSACVDAPGWVPAAFQRTATAQGGTSRRHSGSRNTSTGAASRPREDRPTDGTPVATVPGMSRIRPASVRHLQVFCVAARHLSFKLAARQLHLTPSAVSHRIRELESSLGIELFERRTRSVELTEAGRTLHTEVAPLLDAVEQSMTNVAQRLQRQRLRVAAPQFFASDFLIPRLAGFSARWPQVDLRLESAEPRPTTPSASADVAIVISSHRPQGVRAMPLFELRLVAACSPKYRTALGPLPGRLPGETVLLVHRSWADGWARWTEATGIELPAQASTVEFDTTYSLLRAAEHGLGVALAPAYLGDAWLQGGTLIPIDGTEAPTGETYWFTARESDLHRSEVRAFRDWAVTGFSGR
jgi:LysR family glycine cleavage system transcriptional activator